MLHKEAYINVGRNGEKNNFASLATSVAFLTASRRWSKYKKIVLLFHQAPAGTGWSLLALSVVLLYSDEYQSELVPTGQGVVSSNVSFRSIGSLKTTNDIIDRVEASRAILKLHLQKVAGYGLLSGREILSV